MERDLRSRWWALAVLCAGTLVVILDQSVVGVALSALQHDLGFTPAGLAWVVNSYLVAFGGLLLLAGRVGDLLGRRRVFLAGLTLFTVASLACGLAGDATTLVVARFAQGIGGAMSSAVLLGVVVTLFPEPAQRARALGVVSFVQASGTSIGLLVGGALTHLANWHWVFFINLPIGAAAVALGFRLLEPDAVNRPAGGADAPGAVLVTAALVLGVYTIVSGASPWWGALAVALLVAFLVREARAAHPLLPLRLFRSRTLSGANLVQALLIAGMFGFQFLVALYQQKVLGFDALGTGLGMAPVAVTIAVLSLGFSARLAVRFGERAVLLGGLALIVVGLVGLAALPGGYLPHLLPSMLLMGVGFGAAMPALMGLGMAGAGATDSGLVSGLFNTTQLVGGSLGLSALTVLATRRAGGVTTPDALAAGYRLAFWAAAVLAAAALGVAAAVLRRTPAPAAPPVPVG